VSGAPENFQSRVEGHGLACRSIGVDMQAFVQSLKARKVMAGIVKRGRLALARHNDRDPAFFER
jgi:hypothetical protein